MNHSLKISVSDLRLSRWVLMFLSSVMWRRVVVGEYRRFGGACCILLCGRTVSWRRRQQIPRNIGIHLHTTKLHSVISQKYLGINLSIQSFRSTNKSGHYIMTVETEPSRVKWHWMSGLTVTAAVLRHSSRWYSTLLAETPRTSRSICLHFFPFSCSSGSRVSCRPSFVHGALVRPWLITFT